MIELKRPSLNLFPTYMEFIGEMVSQHEKIWEDLIQKGTESPEQFVDRVLRSEVISEAGRVTETTYWAEMNGVVVGRIALRHELNESLNEFGGHIGYEVRPSYRRVGIAKEMLALILRTSRAQEIGRVLLTCDPENIASNKTITANGGVLSATRMVERIKRNTNYYWIEIKTP